MSSYSDIKVGNINKKIYMLVGIYIIYEVLQFKNNLCCLVCGYNKKVNLCWIL